MLADFQYLILRPISADIDNMMILSILTVKQAINYVPCHFSIKDKLSVFKRHKNGVKYTNESCTLFCFYTINTHSGLQRP